MLRTLVSALSIAICPAQDGADDQAKYTPHIEAASEQAELATKALVLPPGFQVKLIAAEPLLANPVCFWPAQNGSFYVAESFRVRAGVHDMRDHLAELDQDLACETVEDRVAMFKAWSGDQFQQEYTLEQERIRVLRDTDGDGILEQSGVFAGGFNLPATGLGAGLIEHEGSVYYACVPDLWKLTDADGDLVADQREVLSTGYGVRVSLLGHDLHGLQIGPDGWLYFSCGDRGFNVQLESGAIVSPNAGAVLRCRLDGSQLELVHTGLCNPQELAFDHLGNLFTVDAPALPGEAARWVQIIQGADSGWRSSYRWMDSPAAGGPWATERLGEVRFEGQAAYLLPPIVLLRAQPSGLAYYPGSGSGLADHFFLGDFHGERESSGIQSLALKPKGASFELLQRRAFIGQVQASDVDFAPDGSMCFTDWPGGRGNSGKGRIYRGFDEGVQEDEAVQALFVLLTKGAAELELDALEVLLKHSDMRARRLAQFELVRRGSSGWERFQRVLKNASDPLASIHSVWGIGMAAQADASLLEFLHPFLRDASPLVRAQTARVLGDHRYTPAISHLISALQDPDATVRCSAAIACGRLAEARAVEALIQLALNDAHEDPTLRHAASWALSQCATGDQLSERVSHPSQTVRLCSVVALRLQGSERVAEYLEDSAPLVVLEAARAITDLELAGALPALAKLITRDERTDPLLLRRVLAANLRLGGEENLEALAAFAVDPTRPSELRADAITMLANWSSPSNRDYLAGHWSPLAIRDFDLAQSLLQGFVTEAMPDAPDPVLRAWMQGVAALSFAEKEKVLKATLIDSKRESSTRISALEWLHGNAIEELPDLMKSALMDDDAGLRSAVLDILLATEAEWNVPLFESVLSQGNIRECRAIYMALSGKPVFSSQRLLLQEFDKFNQKTLAPELHMDLIEAMYSLDSNATRLIIERLRSRRKQLDPTTAKWVDTLWGGDAQAGREVYEQDSALACTRCHLNGEGAEQGVGPDLTGVAQRLTRFQLLEAILLPNRQITAGYESTLFILTNGELVPGRVLDSDGEGLRILQASGEIRVLDPAQIQEQKPDLSAMPQGLESFIKPRVMRDLIEYLSTL